MRAAQRRTGEAGPGGCVSIALVRHRESRAARRDTGPKRTVRHIILRTFGWLDFLPESWQEPARPQREVRLQDGAARLPEHRSNDTDAPILPRHSTAAIGRSPGLRGIAGEQDRQAALRFRRLRRSPECR